MAPTLTQAAQQVVVPVWSEPGLEAVLEFYGEASCFAVWRKRGHELSRFGPTDQEKCAAKIAAGCPVEVTP